MAPSLPDAPVQVDRVVLLGMMGSGKSTVGAELAGRLGWEHLDLDREIERLAGCSVREIFARAGEARFRELEAEATEGVAPRSRVVLSPGGGWITRPALLDGLPPRTLSVWLRVSPEEVLRRTRTAPGERPLLAVPDPLDAVHRLLAERAPLYARADLEVDTDGRGIPQIVEQIHHEIRARSLTEG